MNARCGVFTAEACAVSEALKWCLCNNVAVDILILTDSLSVINALDNNKINAYINDYIMDIRRSYFALINRDNRPNKKIIIGWIPAHKGIYGNDAVDTLAKEATEELPYEGIKTPFKDLRPGFRQQAFNDTNKEVKALAEFKGRFYFQNFFYEKARHVWFASLNFPRRFVVFVNRLRANHYNLRESLERKGYVASVRCECGAEKEDINHMVFACSMFDDQRRIFYKELDELGASRPDSVWNWLRKVELTTLKALYRFVLSTGRII